MLLCFAYEFTQIKCLQILKILEKKGLLFPLGVFMLRGAMRFPRITALGF